MKRKNDLRTLEELWDLETKHPVTDSNPAGLLRWLYSTGMLRGPQRTPNQRRDRRKLKGRARALTS